LGDDGATVPGDTVAEPLVWFPVARHVAKPELTKMAAIHNWMKGLKQNKKLIELCLPGSHDAGVYHDLERPPFRGYTHKVNPGPAARCQYGPILNQAMDGSRVFDIRVFLRDEFVTKPGERPPETPNKYTPTMGHFFYEKGKGRLGAYGGTLMTALHDAAHFLEEQPSEFLIFRIGHTECTKKVAEVLNQFRGEAKHEDESDAYATHRQGVIYTGAKVNLAHLEHQQLKGKLLLVFDNQFMLSAARWARDDDSPDFSNVDGYYPYDKYPYIPLIGLSFCGKYSGDVGDTAIWKKDEKKGNWTAESADILAHVGCEEHEKHRGNSNHLLWVYWQQTGGNIAEKTNARGGMRDRLGNFLKDVSTNSKLAMPNVIGHDFVTKETCASIVKLNPDLKDTSFT
jgi:hypothetical protein